MVCRRVVTSPPSTSPVYCPRFDRARSSLSRVRSGPRRVQRTGNHFYILLPGNSRCGDSVQHVWAGLVVASRLRPIDRRGGTCGNEEFSGLAS